PRIQSKPRIRPKSCIQSKPFCRNQKSTKEIGNVFERQIEKLLNKHEIKAHIFPCRQGDGGIDIIATFKRRNILIQCKNVGSSIDVNKLKIFETSVSRFGKEVLSVIVYNSKKLKNNPLTTNAETWRKGSCPNICIETEKTIVDCIKNKITQTKFKQTEESEELEESMMELEESTELESGLANELDDELSESESEQYFEETFSVKQTSFKNGQDIKRHIENLLNQNGIIANLFPQRRGDNGIDIIATFKRKIILIKCINVSSPDDNILRDFQASVYRFGEGILNVICCKKGGN
ncbi:12558_t:CDS:2, partial [Racocetra fulgida]